MFGMLLPCAIAGSGCTGKRLSSWTTCLPLGQPPAPVRGFCARPGRVKFVSGQLPEDFEYYGLLFEMNAVDGNRLCFAPARRDRVGNLPSAGDGRDRFEVKPG